MVRHRTSPRNGCFSASEQLFFDFRVTREAAGKARATRRRSLKTGAKIFREGE